jgi:hypothetical protein
MTNVILYIRKEDMKKSIIQMGIRSTLLQKSNTKIKYTNRQKNKIHEKYNYKKSKKHTDAKNRNTLKLPP